MNIFLFVGILAGFFLVWMLLCMLFKHLYSYLRFAWLVSVAAIKSPSLMWDLHTRRTEDMGKQLKPLFESVESDGVYKTLDWFSQPIEMAYHFASTQWYFARHRESYRRWQRMKHYQRQKKGAHNDR